MDLEQQMSAIGLTDSEPTPVESTEPTAETQATPEAEALQQPQPDEEIQLLKRVVARDPQLRQAYMAEKLGIELPPDVPAPVQPQPEAPVTPQFKMPEIQLPFDNADNPYDAMNPEHQRAVVASTLIPVMQEMLAPFVQFIEETKRENQQYAQQQRSIQTEQMDKQLNEYTDTLVPGFSALWSKQNLSLEESTVRDQAARLFQAELSQYPEKTWTHPRVQQEVIKTIAPQIKTLADRFAIFQAPAVNGQPEPAVQRPPAAYVEPSANVPTVPTNKFDDAYKKKDFSGMMSAIGRTV